MLRICRRGSRPRCSALVGGPSGPMLLSKIAAIRPDRIEPEGPPTSLMVSQRAAVYPVRGRE
ncbi:DUF6053 domain-containing protein [Lysobacter enzymogenes]|uniref:DUF6053 domain-containing protein n=1 Tax=Lysobacter enzymogenes TaxID=69 RepID=UPI003D18D9B2